jgi:hypothetical protein
MNIKHLNNNQIDKQKWDESIESASFSSIYALSWYLDIVSPNWNALMADDYAFVFPLTVKQKLKSINYIGIPNFCQQLGVFSKEQIDEKILAEFLEALPKSLIRKDIHLNHSNPLIQGAKQKDNYVLSSSDISTVRKTYSSQTKRNLKKAQNNQLSLVKNVYFNALISLFKETKGKTIEKVDYSVLERLCVACSSRAMLHTYGVYALGELVSGAVFFEFNQRWYMVLLASAEKGKALLASTFLIDAVLEELASKGIVLDFEGSSIPSLARFYQGFGGVNEPYQLYTKRLI